MSDSLAVLAREVLAFRDERDWGQFHTPRHLAAALSVEVAELQELLLWKTDDDVNGLIATPQGAEMLRHELADVFAYTLLLADRVGADLGQCLLEKLTLNGSRYPVDLARGRADKYTSYSRDRGSNSEKTE